MNRHIIIQAVADIRGGSFFLLCYHFCYQKPPRLMLPDKKENPEALIYKASGSGISRTRTYDPHDVNVVL